jgi:xanthine dehydrogenase YagT iron-sulfur-binding subunit
MTTLDLTRRDLLAHGAAAGSLGATALNGPAMADQVPAALPASAAAASEPVTLRINGRDVALRIEPRVSLLDALRSYAGLTGTKKGCDRGSCGACTVHIDGRRVNACLTLAIRAQGHQIVTIEGLAQNGQLHPMQAAFCNHDAFQCGYCTPGQIMSAVALIQEGHARSDAEIREWMTGNICRCGAYNTIVDAINDVAGHKQSAKAS